MDTKPPFISNILQYTEERFTVDKNGKETLDYKITFKHNEYNKIVEIINYSKNRLIDIQEYIYDDFQNLTDILVKTSSGNEKQHISFEYTGNTLRKSTNISKNFRSITKYDELANPIEESFFKDAKTAPYITKYHYAYDKNHKIKQQQKSIPDGKLDRVIRYKYNKKGLLLEEKQTDNISKSLKIGTREVKTSLESVTKYAYDIHDNVILSEHHSSGFGDDYHKREIIYDIFGDITQIKTYVKGYSYRYKDDYGLVSVTQYTYVPKE